MKKNLFILCIMLYPVLGFAQQNKERKITAKLFLNDLIFNNVPPKDLISKYFISTPPKKAEKDSLLISMIENVRETTKNNFLNFHNADDLNIITYKSAPKITGYLNFYKKNEDDIYCVVENGTIRIYLLFKNLDIISFTTFSKGKNDWSYFVVL